MAKKTIYVENQLVELVALLERNTAEKKIGDRIAIPAMYGKDCRLFRQSEVYGSIAAVSKAGVYVRQLDGPAGTKVLFQLVSKAAFEAAYSVKETRPTRASAPVAPAAAPATAVPTTPAVAELTAAEKASPVYGAAFQKVRELIPELTKEERAELALLLKEAE